VCDLDAGACLCLSDQGCPQGYFCNSLQSCQSLSGCNSDVDCPATYSCDVATQICTQAGCTADSQCPFEQICDPGSQMCVPGCRTDVDCNLKRSCSSFGQCQDFCTSNDFCDTGMFCNTTTGICYSKGSYCSTPPDPGNPNDPNCSCPNGTTCLYTISEGQQAYCALGCSTEADCPSGYFCSDTWELCTDSRQCPFGAECHGFQAVDEMGLLFICADPNTLIPVVIAMNCGPMTGFCNGTTLP
jgi:hypothetical protein